ncbi:MAG: hypothetical protein FWH14_01990 [Oscillospiraceae bacterium]|nr:hypothetical protein [Oscillospiraceae bacterium]
MESIVIPFTKSNLGRVEFDVDVQTGDKLSFDKVMFKLDSGSDFTTINCNDLKFLGYSQEFLKSCPYYEISASTASDEHKILLQYIPDVSIKFGDRELQSCRLFFSLGTKLRSLFGSDVLKYFNIEINFDIGELRLTQTEVKPHLLKDETPIQIYSIEYD